MITADALSALVGSAKPEELPDLAGLLAHALAVVLARTAASATPVAPAKAVESGGGLLTIDEAAESLGVARSWLYRHARRLPFTRKLGHRTLRFDPAGLERWKAGGTPQ